MTICPAMATSASHEARKRTSASAPRRPRASGHGGEAEEQDEADEHLTKGIDLRGGRLESTARRSSDVRGWWITTG